MYDFEPVALKLHQHALYASSSFVQWFLQYRHQWQIVGMYFNVRLPIEPLLKFTEAVAYCQAFFFYL